MGLTISIPNGATLTTALTTPANISSVVNGVATINSSTVSPAVIELYVGVPGSKAILDATPPLSYDEANQTLSLDTSGFLLKAGNLSGLADVAASRGNLGVYSTGQVDGLLANYLTITAAGATYYPLSNPAGYITSAALTPYLTSATAAATYYPLSNPAGYQTASDVTTALADYRTKVDYDFSNVADTALTTYGLTLLPPSGTTGVYDSYVNSDTYNIYHDFSQGGTVAGNEYKSFINASGVFQNYRNYISDGEGGVILDADLGFSLSSSGLSFRKWDGSLVSGTIQYGSGAIVFGDSTTQTTAFIPADWSPIGRALPSGGVVNQALFKASSTNYDTTWRTVDIYSTTSSTMLTVAKTTQTLTVGTYLGYTPLQDVTIAATADPLNQHMHGQVVSYSQTTGVMVVDVQSKTGSGTYSAWTVNIGGIGTNVVPPDGATGKVLGKASATDYDLAWVTRLDPANNLSDVSNTATARTNLGLGSAATLASSAVAQTANNLSDLANAGTARTNLGLGTAATRADSYFLQTANNLSDVTASTARTNLGLGAAATASFATPLQSSQLTSTTLANNPQSLLGNIFADTAPLRPVSSAFVAASSGTGASGAMYYATALAYCPNATISGYGGVYYGIEAHSPYSGARAIVNWTKTIGFTCFINRESAAWSNGMTIRVTIGKGSSGGTLTTRGVGLDIVAGATYVKILAHNGTTLTTTDSTYAVSNLTGNYVKQMSVISYGNGTAELFVDGVSYGTTSGAPTTVGSSGQNRFSMECYGDGTQSSSLPVLFFHPKVISSL